VGKQFVACNVRKFILQGFVQSKFGSERMEKGNLLQLEHYLLITREYEILAIFKHLMVKHKKINYQLKSCITSCGQLKLEDFLAQAGE